MENLFTKKVPLYFETEESQLILGDSFKILTEMEPASKRNTSLTESGLSYVRKY